MNVNLIYAKCNRNARKYCKFFKSFKDGPVVTIISLSNKRVKTDTYGSYFWISRAYTYNIHKYTKEICYLM